MKRLALVLLVMASCHSMASPCSGVDRTLTDERKAELAPVIAEQLNVAYVDVLQSYRYRGWFIVYVNTHVSDETFLFYPGDPIKNGYLTKWGGAATKYEGREIAKWVRQNAKGVPSKLASCFAWHVTQDRDQ